MEKIKVKPDVYWVGAIDWDIRNFHGYTTKRGTTYNAYLIVDKKVTLVDTVKHYLFDEMLSRIKEIVDPSKIDYIISNHVEMDHSGSLPKLLQLAPNAKIITSNRGEKGLRRHYKKGWDFNVVDSGDNLTIGDRTLQFVHVPMIHWPDSMVTYSEDDALLLPNDAFGQHIASSERFDDQVGWSVLEEEAAKYYANIVMPYGSQVQKALDKIADLDIDMIAPSHGVIWRSYIDEITENYIRWSQNKTGDKALIVYDSMWGSTEKIAYALAEGLRESEISVKLRNLKVTHVSDIMTDVLSSRCILLGSPTLNNGMMPSMGGFLTYLKGLRPKNRLGFAFGSYGWSGQAVGEIEDSMSELSWEQPVESININYVPDKEELDKFKEKGRDIAKYLKK